jgi:4-oxalocrotonate tautomerase
MPLVRINLSHSYSAEERQIIGDTVYAAMVDIAKAPAGDKFLIFTRHADGELVHPDGAFMGMEYSSKIVFVQVFWVAGRSTDVKKAFYRNIADTLNDKIGIRKDDVWINLVDCAREDWSFGNGDMQYAPK